MIPTNILQIPKVRALVRTSENPAERIIEHLEEGGDPEDESMARKLRRVNVKTMPYPGFPTDMQPQVATALCLANGTSVITEGIYDNRFKYTNELRKMGAEIQVDGRVAVIEGGRRLTGAPVHACDLRAGAAMVIAGMCASGTTVVEDVRYIERGYENFVGKLQALGADIQCVDEPDEPDSSDKIVCIC